MRFHIIQLSDIHFKTKENSLLEKEGQLFDSLKNVINAPTIILVSGDSAFSGSNDEFLIAMMFYEDLCAQINEYSKQDVRILVIPGNHDCQDLLDECEIRESVLATIQDPKKPNKTKLIEEAAKTLRNYYEFEKSFNSNFECLYTSDLLKVYKYEVQGKVVIFNCYNTAFQSIIHETPGKMVMPIDLLDEDVTSIAGDLKISCFHHPFHWLSPEENRRFKSHIYSTSDFFFTGHEHIDSAAMISDLEDNVIYHIEGGVLQDNYNRKLSVYHILTFDFEKQSFQIKTLKLHGERYISNEGSEKWNPMHKTKGVLLNPYLLTESHKLKLNDIGANFSHPNIANITLKDIYIYPNLEQINQLEDTGTNVAVLNRNSQDLLEALEGDIRIMFSGPENVGKTSLLKVYYMKLHEQNLIPIMLDGHQIKNTSPDDLRKLFKMQFLDQYTSNDESDFDQLDNRKLVIIVDDFNRSKLNPKYKARLLQNLITHYPNIIIAGNEFMSLEDIITDEMTKDDLYSTFKMFEIKEFGFQLRAKLVNRWNTLGVEHTITEPDRIRKLQNAETVINTVIGVNFVPSFPFFILTILQSIELGNPTDLSASTFGHYYNFLIQKTFSSILKTQREITEYENYLSEFSYYLFDRKIQDFDTHEFNAFDRGYRERFTISHSLDKIKENLLSASVLELNSGIFEYKYSYIHYYFVSSYISNHLTENNIKQVVVDLTDKLYKSEYSNILMFMTHHTKDKFLLTELLGKARSIFSNIKPIKLQEDIKNINSLVEKMPEMVFESRSIDEYRDEENSYKDNKNSPPVEPDSSIEPQEEESEINIVSDMNTAFKSIEIIGQILKNNYGKIENSDITHLIEETILLGLRTLNVFFTIIEGNSEFVINQVNSIIAEIEKARGKKLDNPKKIELLSKSTLFGLCSQISYSFIKKISDSIGTEYLNEILEKVYKNQDYNSVRLLRLAIKLDHYRGFPDSDLKKLKEELDGLHLPTQIMNRLVINHLYLYPTNHVQKDRILNLLNIPVKTQVRIDQTSQQKK